MNMKKITMAILLLIAGGVAVSAQDASPLYKDPSATVEARVADLLTRMTLEEKAAQMHSEKKKRHQVLKWVTGAVVLAVLCVHVVHPAVVPAVTWAASAVLLVAFVWHGWTGMKSLARDLRVPGKAKVPLRIALVALALIAFLVMVVARL